MILSAHQPAYMPWLGYFHKIQNCDLFVYLDSVQYEKNSFINRNKIKTPSGPQWLTIPVKLRGHTSATLLETEIDDSLSWRKKHLRSIELNYRKAPFFSENFPKIEELLALPATNLSDFCFHNLRFWMSEFQIQTTVVRSSTLPVYSAKSDLVLDLCSHFTANRYLSGALGRDYLNLSKFCEAGISIDFQNFSHPIYRQLWGPFERCMGIIDLWMNCGSSQFNFAMENSFGI